MSWSNGVAVGSAFKIKPIFKAGDLGEDFRLIDLGGKRGRQASLNLVDLDNHMKSLTSTRENITVLDLVTDQSIAVDAESAYRVKVLDAVRKAVSQKINSNRAAFKSATGNTFPFKGKVQVALGPCNDSADEDGNILNERVAVRVTFMRDPNV